MKKLFAMILALALALGCTAALAETAEKQTITTVTMNGVFEIKGAIPEGYRLLPVVSDDSAYITTIVSDDDAKPIMVLSIAYNELYTDVDRLNDLGEDDLAFVEESFTSEDTVEFTYMETAYGTKLLVAQESLEAVDFVDFYTIYKGYEVEFALIPGTEPLTDEDIAAAIAFLSDVDFIAAGE